MAAQMETARLIIRSLQEEDLNDYHNLIFSDEEVCRYYTDKVSTIEETREGLTYRILEAKYAEFQRWAVVRKEDRQFLGIAGLESGPNFWYRFKSDPEPKYNSVEVELSFAFGRPYWGKGYATEACEKIIEYAFTELKLPRLMGGFHPQNEQSHRLHVRLGFQVEKEASGDGYVALLENNR
ncbi:MAG: GNAT family N-acetyltransferase [Candidatus Latescibacteria bacterium]|nr:GNAT family N-acetyltransferase [Candidatus Latescibacterota bacterium]